MDFNEVFEFGSKEGLVGSKQTEYTCQSLFDFFQASLDKVCDGPMEKILDRNHVHWFPEYASAVMRLGDVRIGCHKKPSMELVVICLDKWKNEVQSCSSFHHVHSFASSFSFGVFPLLPIPQSKVDKFWTTTAVMICNANQRKGDERSSAGGKKQGHQKTPGFLLTVLHSAIEHILSGKESITNAIEYPPVPGWTGRESFIFIASMFDFPWF